MLVLSRKANQTIVVDNAVRVTVIGIKGDRVRLGVEAPPEVTVDRGDGCGSWTCASAPASAPSRWIWAACSSPGPPATRCTDPGPTQWAGLPGSRATTVRRTPVRTTPVRPGLLSHGRIDASQ